MATRAARSPTRLADGEVFVRVADGQIRVGTLEDIVRLVGGPAWTITYTERHRERYPDLDTSDEGITIDGVDVVNDMSFEAAFVETLRSLPADPLDDGDVSPRLGLFVGRLLSDLQTGLE